ncbi:MAG TPA: methylenetetrahydrofolate reductase, partial [Pseudorhizobium sp.]|nr:methylenetetrahydrofolate reductase [Pseudorhizobium sp.]
LDLRKLLVPHEPNDFVTDLASYKVTHPESLIEQLHLFPLGGIQASTDWLARMQGEAGIQEGEFA